MHARPRVFAALAVLGVTLGVIVAILGLPYGRMSYDAFAELYHGEVDTTSTVHMAIDCDVASGGTDSNCTVMGTDVTLAVSVGNSLGASATIIAFNFRVTNDREDVFDPTAGFDTNLNSNPDFYDATAPTGWMCSPPAPNPDEDPNPGISVSFLSCNVVAVPVGTIPFPDDPAHVRLAEINYDNVNPVNPATASFTLSDVNVFDDTGTELMSCNPVNVTPGPCFGATVTNIPPPTMNGDQDNDGVPDYTDNCPNNANPGQENADGNFISNAPIYVVHDLTRAMSDSQGDACDNDMDNDTYSNHYEESAGPAACPGNVPYHATFANLADSDGDRFRDNAECILGSHPYDSSSMPALALCGPNTDADSDGLSARLEFCFYGTGATSVDSDGDGAKDGCEAVSLNGDTDVNSGDQGLLGAELIRAVPDSQKLAHFDVNPDGAINSGDQGLQANRIGKCS